MRRVRSSTAVVLWLGGLVVVCAAVVLTVAVLSESTPADGRPSHRQRAIAADPQGDLPDPWLLPRVSPSPLPVLVAVGSAEESRRQAAIALARSAAVASSGSVLAAGADPAFDDAPRWFVPRGSMGLRSMVPAAARPGDAGEPLAAALLSPGPLSAVARDELWWSGLTERVLLQIDQGLLLRGQGWAEPWDLRIDLSRLGAGGVSAGGGEGAGDTGASAHGGSGGGLAGDDRVGDLRGVVLAEQWNLRALSWRDERGDGSSRGGDGDGGVSGLWWSPRSRLTAGAFTDLPFSDKEYMDLRLQQVWGIGRASSISIGLQHLRGVMSNDQPELPLERDSILLELKIGF